MTSRPYYKRVLLKLSGEALLGNRDYGIDPDIVSRIAQEVSHVLSMGVELCIVVGGGNIFRGVAGASKGMDRVTADYMGMLATVINGLALQTALGAVGVDARVQSAIPMEMICETYVRRRALDHLAKNRVVIFTAGSGNPFFTTDTPAALRASEMSCNALLKATKVDGVYDKDPAIHPDAVRYDKLSYLDVLSRDLRVMDASAISLARENNIPIVVFSIQTHGAFAEIVQGKGKFTLISEEKDENGRFSPN
ncbi:MAG: UMP kinase [Alphaproteobacteria bacterium]|nr:UMP kinase [Alphaproteobacteria bacterium]